MDAHPRDTRTITYTPPERAKRQGEHAVTLIFDDAGNVEVQINTDRPERLARAAQGLFAAFAQNPPLFLASLRDVRFTDN